MRVAAARHSGAYWEIGQTFAKLSYWLEQAGVPMRTMVAVYYDDPSRTPVEELRSDAGTSIEGDMSVIHEHLHVVDIAGGEYAVATHIGPYSELGSAWGRFVGEWLPSSGRVAPPRRHSKSTATCAATFRRTSCGPISTSSY